MKKSALYTAIMLFFCSLQLKAQYSFTGSLTASVSIQPVMAFSLTANASTAITLSNSAYSNGYTIPNFNTVMIKSNMPWSLSVSAATPYFSASGSYASSNMPASVIGLTKSGQSPSVQLTATPQLLASGGRGNTSQTGNTFNMDFSAAPGYNYGPGIYSLTISYTLTAQ